jgi:hypothetical protein
MKNFFLALGLLLATQTVSAQQKPTELDKSPLDVTYMPANYPVLKMKNGVNGEPMARVLYSRPLKKGREIFGEEVKYDEIWRIGANESTEIELFRNATIGGKKVPKGRYTVYCVPTANKWTLIFNKENYSWGSYSYKPEKDVAKVDVPVQKNAESVEALTMYFDNSNWIIMWDTVKVEVPVSF